MARGTDWNSGALTARLIILVGAKAEEGEAADGRGAEHACAQIVQMASHVGRCRRGDDESPLDGAVECRARPRAPSEQRAWRANVRPQVPPLWDVAAATVKVDEYVAPANICRPCVRGAPELVDASFCGTRAWSDGSAAS